MDVAVAVLLSAYRLLVSGVDLQGKLSTRSSVDDLKYHPETASTQLTFHLDVAWEFYHFLLRMRMDFIATQVLIY